jgi:hypothetical protein
MAWEAKLGDLGPTILMLLERDPSKRVRIKHVRPLWADILRRVLASRT